MIKANVFIFLFFSKDNSTFYATVFQIQTFLFKCFHLASITKYLLNKPQHTHPSSKRKEENKKRNPKSADRPKNLCHLTASMCPWAKCFIYLIFRFQIDHVITETIYRAVCSEN